MVGAGGEPAVWVALHHPAGGHLQDRHALAVRDGEVQGRCPRQAFQELFGLGDGAALFQDLALAQRIGQTQRVERLFAVLDVVDFQHPQGQPRVVHARQATEQARKPNRHERSLAPGPVDGNEAVVVQIAQGRIIEVPAQDRSARGAAFACQRHRRAGKDFFQIEKRVTDHHPIPIRLAGLHHGVHFRPIFGREAFHHAVARTAEEAPQGIGTAFFEQIEGKTQGPLARGHGQQADTFADLLGAARHCQDRQTVDVGQLRLPMPARRKAKRLRGWKARNSEENQATAEQQASRVFHARQILNASWTFSV